MLTPITPDSDPKEIEEFANNLPLLINFLKSDPVARQLFDDVEKGRLSQEDLLARLIERSMQIDNAGTDNCK
jgi:hypothetical protein